MEFIFLIFPLFSHEFSSVYSGVHWNFRVLTWFYDFFQVNQLLFFRFLRKFILIHEKKSNSLFLVSDSRNQKLIQFFFQNCFKIQSVCFRTIITITVIYMITLKMLKARDRRFFQWTLAPFFIHFRDSMTEFIIMVLRHEGFATVRTLVWFNMIVVISVVPFSSGSIHFCST